ncbi:PiggyBac transposable element-derived protein 4-like [Plakobranchus ocellatus]|uniref:PiggyBac transposable element-derived protein 4-like n=1 Tax=Plakobranchus ocellatus TaxID=259542 RepID=A0AAV4B6X6_9GAST|nr:PiggyBac transposable element-derived protein 4-like [Plakobranchus ocellatus]
MCSTYSLTMALIPPTIQKPTKTGQAVKIFDTLLKVLEGKGYHIFADRYYTTRRLIDHLITQELHYTGTVQTNRVGFPPEIKSLRIGHMETRH